MIDNQITSSKKTLATTIAMSKYAQMDLFSWNGKCENIYELLASIYLIQAVQENAYILIDVRLAHILQPDVQFGTIYLLQNEHYLNWNMIAECTCVSVTEQSLDFISEVSSSLIPSYKVLLKKIRKTTYLPLVSILSFTVCVFFTLSWDSSYWKPNVNVTMTLFISHSTKLLHPSW